MAPTMNALLLATLFGSATALAKASLRGNVDALPARRANFPVKILSYDDERMPDDAEELMVPGANHIEDESSPSRKFANAAERRRLQSPAPDEITVNCMTSFTPAPDQTAVSDIREDVNFLCSSDGAEVWIQMVSGGTSDFFNQGSAAATLCTYRSFRSYTADEAETIRERIENGLVKLGHPVDNVYLAVRSVHHHDFVYL
uniref:Uncharacterized protein n=1 Tax=Pinguiococcus pyrenoidosus TaxID=172671 RepID=A0A7R9YB39_9STRA|mmetsp:Transcript_1778/g.7734  ORF Transcript_1778/g.7734 Transcript_1778/m.7734 type:complete len:201 (+) Transcript_1778:248-850(+)